jgi:hypothetical protein
MTGFKLKYTPSRSRDRHPFDRRPIRNCTLLCTMNSSALSSSIVRRGSSLLEAVYGVIQGEDSVSHSATTGSMSSNATQYATSVMLADQVKYFVE